ERLLLGRTVSFTGQRVRSALYRPFCKQFMYFDDTLVHRPGQFPRILPGPDSGNLLIWLKIGGDWPFFALTSNVITDQLPQGGSQCFPFYTYAEDGTNRRENITDWALEQFRAHYSDPSITKWDILHYIYAVLHHPEYRQRYAANLRRELPRIPFAGTSGAKAQIKDDADAALKRRSSTGTPQETQRDDSQANRPAKLGGAGSGAPEGAPFQSDIEIFRALVKAGRRLAEIHVHYEQQPEYPLTKTEKAGEKLDYRVTKMRLSKDKTSLIYNQFLTLSGIPPDTYEYRLGNRSALEWVIDQYQVSTDKRSGITND